MTTYRGTTVLVLGATGFLGRWVSRLLSLAGANLHMVVRDPPGGARLLKAWGIGGRTVQADLTDPTVIPPLVAQVRPAIVFNLAGYGVDLDERDSDLMSLLNAELPEAVAEALPSIATDSPWRGLSLVHAGSVAEYGPLKGLIHEGSRARPSTLYGITKLEGTRRVAQVSEAAGVRAATARLATVYGPGEHPHRLLPSLFRAADGGKPLDLTPGEQRRDFTYVEEVAVGLLDLGLLPEVPEAVVNLCTGRQTQLKEFVMTAVQVLGMGEDLIRLGALEYRGDEVWQGPLSTDRIESLLQWKPSMTPAEGIAAARESSVPDRRDGDD